MVEWSEGLAVFEIDVTPALMNSIGAVHGGVPMTLIDVVCTYAGVYCEDPERQRRAITLSLNTSFLRPVSEGTLKGVGRKQGGGRTIYFARGEIFDADDRLIATGDGTFRYVSDER
jgi:uncharacterized protein (TIGR00369 family)